MNWQTLVAADQRLAGLELAASITAPHYDSGEFWTRWNLISQHLDNVVDEHRWPWNVRDVAYSHLLKAFEDAADARGTVVR